MNKNRIKEIIIIILLIASVIAMLYLIYKKIKQLFSRQGAIEA